MRKPLILLFSFFLFTTAFAQTDTSNRTPVKPITLSRANDHFLLQFGYTMWTGKPDSIQTKGIPRSFNAYFMFDFPFKTNPHWSVGIGAGIAADNIYFDKTTVEIAGRTPNLVFRNTRDTNNFKNYKLATAYAEAPLELRYRTNPENDRKSIKMALGVKIGLLVNAHTKGRTLQSRSGETIDNYKVKEFGRNYFNTRRVAFTARAGYGNFSLFGAYQATPLFKEGLGPAVRPLTLGLTISGL